MFLQFWWGCSSRRAPERDPLLHVLPKGSKDSWGVVPSIGMMPLDEGGSETESLYEIEGMNKWILYL